MVLSPHKGLGVETHPLRLSRKRRVRSPPLTCHLQRKGGGGPPSPSGERVAAQAPTYLFLFSFSFWFCFFYVLKILLSFLLFKNRFHFTKQIFFCRPHRPLLQIWLHRKHFLIFTLSKSPKPETLLKNITKQALT